MFVTRRLSAEEKNGSLILVWVVCVNEMSRKRLSMEVYTSTEDDWEVGTVL